MTSIDIPIDILRSMRTIVDYNYNAEQKHFNELKSSGSDVDEHIFNHLKKMDEFLFDLNIK